MITELLNNVAFKLLPLCGALLIFLIALGLFVFLITILIIGGLEIWMGFQDYFANLENRRLRRK